MKRKLIIGLMSLSVFFGGFHTAYAQTEVLNSYRKNTIHGSLGTLLLLNTANVFYDRIITESKGYNKFTTFVRAGYNSFYAVSIARPEHEDLFTLEGGMLLGGGFSHFEAAVGGTIYDIQKILPAFSLAYRGQRPGKGFMFRGGIGTPEFIFVGMGYSF